MCDDTGLHERERCWGDEIDRGQHECLRMFQNTGKQTELQSPEAWQETNIGA